ncbi:hypothetical protein CLAFUW4_07907 [Fulvia fulva]|uniref:Oxidoreductase n=1 Tax=Passalora fulva TaxID=5499 RepID=A0A9Q8P6S1_PASFU|nr:uncharacterized protein CLAFUR5_08032 [Fulvia fulva]KAK4628784.1 hypothetical protein CLAFUR4_07912 [Fulvia fulva]KAK4629992.1 hypothetical protein CLAFUR0_07909 [Fulvia fulva]UJO15328.1 hypothetical protein CLAFUR5_08032 [Fulvia fulva]WPV12986.1 hypothetical protein CLAFUW4_07907 [Fulvia fulva]WPV27863.1 hypothetical protein CLAFUW7_07908 [Fulvia fulva]
MSSASFNPSKDIPSLTGKVIFITGGTAGLGSGSIRELAKHDPSHIYFSGRNEKNANSLIERVRKDSPTTNLTFIPCDISSLASVAQASQRLTSLTSRLDILMLNAGIMATAAATSQEGYEIQMATNHLGHALLVKLLLPTLLSTASLGADVRVINMSSIAYKQAPSPGISFPTLKSAQPKLGGAVVPGHRWARYGQSKLAQLLYSQELAKHHPEITSVAVHPGYIMTGLFDGLPMMTALPVLLVSLGRRTPVERGHYNQCWAATCEKGKLRNGGYYEPIGVLTKPATKQANDEKLAGELWRWTEEQLEGY